MKLTDLLPAIIIEQAGGLLGICRRSAYRAATNSELHTIRLGRRLIAPTARVLELLELSEGRLAGEPVEVPV